MIGCAIVVGTGVLYMLLGRPYARGTSPSGDAVKRVAATTPRSATKALKACSRAVRVALAQDRGRVDRDQHDRGEL